MVDEYGDGAAVFMRAAEHREPPRPRPVLDRRPTRPVPERGRVGLYHLAWEVDTIQDLAAMRERLVGLGALVGESDHGVSKSLYGKDPDGIEFEVHVDRAPRSLGRSSSTRPSPQRLDLDAELARYG